MGIFNNFFSNNEQNIDEYNKLLQLKENVLNEQNYNKKLEEYQKLFNYIENISDTNSLNNYIIKNSRKDTIGFSTVFGWYNSKNIIESLYQSFKMGYANCEKKANAAKIFSQALANIPKHNIRLEKNVLIRRELANMKEVTFSKIGKLFDRNKLIKFVVIDIETTELNTNNAEIIEISAIKYVDFEPSESFTTLIKPNNVISKEITKINAISNDMVESAPSLNEVMKDFDDFVNGYNIVGYNTMFDLKFLYVNGSAILEQKNIKYYDVCDLAKKVFKIEDNFELNSICELNGLFRNEKHRSLSNCFATSLIFAKCIEVITNNK